MRLLHWLIFCSPIYMKAIGVNDSYAHDFGTHGHTFEIIEPDLLKQIEGKLIALEKNGELSKHKDILTQKAKKAIHTPEPVKGITKTTKDRIFYYDPSIIVPYDLKDHEGKTFHKAGTKINPLKFRSLSSPLIFIDGNDKAQVTWAQVSWTQGSWVETIHLKSGSFPKIILTSGSPFQLMEQWMQPVYFDQGGRLTTKLGIKHVPAIVTQEGLKLKITEIALENLK